MTNTQSKYHEDNDEFYLLFLIYIKWKNPKNPEYIHSRYKKKYYRQLNKIQKRIRCRVIPRVALTDPAMSAICALLNSRNDQAYITATGLDYTTFHELNSEFKELFDNYTPYNWRTKETMKIVKVRTKRGRPRKFTSEMALACVLYHTRSRGGMWSMQLPFGQTQTTMSVWVRFGRKILLHLLKKNPAAKLRHRTAEEWESYVQAVAAKHPKLGQLRVGCTIDGIKLHLEESPDHIIQEMFYNGWTTGHYVTNILVFGMDGTIIFAGINAPGSMHDSRV